ncbi:MAG TPA: 16S rRNA (cytosine(967)-C(5))-methyltransferase RsmB, partial [Desulfobacteraceae bacterium]|nr:16S rRNA (cytosine(967)-C(5))-methyltransferase RsmB [Desulfobacteraceae bacterium]
MRARFDQRHPGYLSDTGFRHPERTAVWTLLRHRCKPGPRRGGPRGLSEFKVTPRNLAFKILRKPGAGPGAFERRLEDAFGNDPKMAPRDRAFAVHLVQGVLRWRSRLDWIINCYASFPFSRIEPDVLTVLRIALYQMLFMDRVPDSAAVNEAVKQVSACGRPHLRSFVNGILREISRHKGQCDFPSREENPVSHLSARYSYPEGMVRKWITELGFEKTEGLLQAGNMVSPMVLRVSSRRISRDELAVMLSAEGIRVRYAGFSPDGLIVEELRRPVGEIEAFRRGFFTVQGEAAQAASRLLAPSPGDHVLDLCAGLGGKTTHLAELTGDRGMVVAVDRNTNRLAEMLRTAGRMDLRSIRPVAADVSENLCGWLGKRFDCIMLDAPCSALGTISRHPDVKWWRKEEDIQRLSRLQARLLDCAIELLRPGGRVLYATCTISREENEDVVESCAARHRSIFVEDLRRTAPGWAEPLLDDSG